MRILTICLIGVLLLFSQSAFSDDAGSVRTEDKYDFLESLARLDIFTDPIKEQLRENNIDLEFFAGVLQGYDNNVNLDPDRKKDGFLEGSFNTEATYNYTDDIRLTVENYTTYLWYYTVNTANLFDIYNEAGLEMDIFDDEATLGIDYAFDLVVFPNDKNGTYVGNNFRSYIKHNITPRLYQKLSYKLSAKSFSHDTTLNGRKEKTDDPRDDLRNGGEYEIGWHANQRLTLKFKCELFRNDSNYTYFDYYDYWSWKIRPSAILMITDKLYTSASFTFQKREYYGRLSTKTQAHVYDDTYSGNLSVMYDLTKSFTAAVSYSYRENGSNEPLQNYSGSVATAGLYYSF